MMILKPPIPGRDLFDRLAIGLSALCVVHCAASVFFIAALATAGGALMHPAVHEIGLALAILLAALGLGRGFIAHRRRVPILLGVSGIVLMALGLTVSHGPAEVTYTILGVGCVALAHILNRRAHSYNCAH